MEIGKNKFMDLDRYYRIKLLEAYHMYLSQKIFYSYQEDFDLADLVGQSQYFEKKMEELYNGFIDLNIDIKLYLFNRSENDLLELDEFICCRDNEIMENLLSMGA
jgi:hypothetical protein